MKPEIIHAATSVWYVVHLGVMHGPFHTLRDAEIRAELIIGKCKDCSA